MIVRTRAALWVVLSFAVLASACGSDGDAATGSPTDDLVEAAESGDTEAVGEAVDDLVDELEEQQESSGGGSASLTVGDQTYDFDSVLCAFGEDEIGQEGAEFVLSAIANGTQLYMSIDSFGHQVSLDDIEDFENPSVSWASDGAEFIQVDGSSVSGEVDFYDGTSESLDTQPGSFEGTCP